MFRFIIAALLSLLALTFSAQAQVKKEIKHYKKIEHKHRSKLRKWHKRRLRHRAGVYYGTASYYDDKFRGQTTADGATYHQKGLTAACNAVPLGTRIRVTNLENHKSITVKVNDRMHARSNRLVDLSKG